MAQFHTFDQFALFYLFRIEYEDQQDRLLKAMQQNVGPHTQMVSDTIRLTENQLYTYSLRQYINGTY